MTRGRFLMGAVAAALAVSVTPALAQRSAGGAEYEPAPDPLLPPLELGLLELEPESPPDPRETAPPLPPLSPPPPRETALPDDSAPPADRCARAGVTLTAKAAATAPIRNLPRVMDMLLSAGKSNHAATGRAAFYSIYCILPRSRGPRCPVVATHLSPFDGSSPGQSLPALI